MATAKSPSASDPIADIVAIVRSFDDAEARLEYDETDPRSRVYKTKRVAAIIAGDGAEPAPPPPS